MTYHLYADDTQLFQEFSLSDNTSPEIASRKLCHQHPSVDENQHAEAERRQNRDPHHPTQISTPTQSSRKCKNRTPKNWE